MILTGLQHPDLHLCRVRQGSAVVCPEAEFRCVNSGGAYVPGRKSRHRGARPRWNLKYDPVFGAKTRDAVSSIPVFDNPAQKQNPLKTGPPAAV
jgi:hypothetical protein